MSVSLEERPLPRRARSVRTNNFLSGFASLFRSFPLSVFPPRKSLWEQSGDDIRECWQDVGDDLRAAMGDFERERGYKTAIHSHEVSQSKGAKAGAVRVINKKEEWRFSKHFEKLDPDTQKVLLALVRELAKD